VVDVFGNLLAVRLRAFDEKFSEVRASVTEQRNRLGDVGDHHGLVDVHLEIASRAAKADRDIVRHDLHGDHRQRVGLRWIDLSRHNRRPGFILGNEQLGETSARAA
jgi:hypothetical protein